MTYGWAILIVIAIIAVAWQMGVFKLSGECQKGASGFWGVVPTDFVMSAGGTSSTLTLSLTNNVGAPVNVTSINATIGATSQATTPYNKGIGAGASRADFQITNLPAGPSGSCFNADISIDYTDSRTNTSFRSSGMLFGSYGS